MKYRKLSELCEYASDKILVSILSRQNYISTENMLQNRGGICDAEILPSTLKVSNFAENDILISNIRPYFKKIWRAKFCGGCSNDILVMRAKQNCNPIFLYYILSSDSFFSYATHTSKGTKMPRGDKKAIMNYQVPDLSYQAQKIIGEFLNVFDRKIELNNKLNDNLQQHLNLLFFQIFTNIIPDIALGEVVETTSGGTPSRKHKEYYENGSICWIKSKELLGSYIHDTEEHINDLALSKSSTKMLPEHSVLIAMYGATVGAYGIISKQMTCNQAICALLSNENYPYTYLFQIAHEQQQNLINMAVGSAQQNISQALVKQLYIHSDIDAIKKFHKLAQPLHQQIQCLERENKTLSEVRDTLLPKLMSGELDVSELDI